MLIIEIQCAVLYIFIFKFSLINDEIMGHFRISYTNLMKPTTARNKYAVVVIGRYGQYRYD